MRRPIAKKIGLLAGIAVFTIACAFTSLAAKERLDTPDDLYWSSTSKDDDADYDEGSYAKWDEVEDANRYRVQLYREDETGSRSKVCEDTTKSTKYNFRSKMTKEGDYYFRVRAESTKSSHSDSLWSSYSDSYYVSASAAENAGNASSDDGSSAVMVIRDSGWETDETGYRYKLDDGTYAANGWFQDPSDQSWYFMDQNGYMMTGFIDYGDNIYYCDPAGTPSGAMVTGALLYDGVVYNFDENGVLVSTEDGLSLEEED